MPIPANLGGTHYYGTARGRELVRAELQDAGLACVTETDKVPTSLLEHAPIDHVCPTTPLAADARVAAAWEGIDVDGVKLSDHSGLVVDVCPRAS